MCDVLITSNQCLRSKAFPAVSPIRFCIRPLIHVKRGLWNVLSASCKHAEPGVCGLLLEVGYKKRTVLCSLPRTTRIVAVCTQQTRQSWIHYQTTPREQEIRPHLAAEIKLFASSGIMAEFRPRSRISFGSDDLLDSTIGAGPST